MSLLTLQPAFTGGELSPSLTARVDMAKYAQGCRTLRNFRVQPHGGAAKRSGFRLLDALPGPAALLKFSFNTEQSYCLAFGERWLEVFTPEGAVLDAQDKVYHIASPYTLAQARRLASAQSGDVLFLAVHGVPPTKLMRYGHADWRFEALSFAAPIAAPASVTVSGSSGPVPIRYFVTAVNAKSQESQLSAAALINGPASNNWTVNDAITITWGAVTGAVEYRVHKSEYGGRPGFIAAVTTGLTFTDRNVTPAFGEGVPTYDHPFPDNDWPGVVGLYEQRLLLASTPNRPQTLWLSKTGDYGNFARYTPLVDDSPLELTIASSEVSALVWARALRTLVLGAAGMEWEVKSGAGAFTARTAQVSPQSYVGSAALPAIIVGNTLLHVARNMAQVRALKYDFGADSYQGSDLTIFSTHLTEQYKLTDWTYQQHPDSIIWAVREDGVLLGLTFQAEHQIFAWHRHDTPGAFKAVCAIPAGREDVLFAEVEREGVHYLEILAPTYTGGDYSRAVFLDSALIYDHPGEPATRYWGLGHLEGRIVGLLADGAVHPPRTVVNGEITLDYPAEVVIAGLEYAADLETMPVEMASQQGVSVGRKKVINEINFLFRETVGAKAGLSFDRLEIIKWRTDEPHGQGLRPFSGLKNVPVP
ncbi:MAG: hypothetical protein LBV70_04220, partial [Candidatus Adiutrix sp.]|nr:hypothetical protein [Candidatus Adiutrix sp.]